MAMLDIIVGNKRTGQRKKNARGRACNGSSILTRTAIPSLCQWAFLLSYGFDGFDEGPYLLQALLSTFLHPAADVNPEYS